MHVRGERAELLVVVVVRERDGHGLEAAEDVELCHRQVRESVHPRAQPDHDEVEPADAPRPPRHRAVLPAAALPQVLRLLPVQLRGKRSRADAARERLHDADHAADRGGADAGTHARRRGDAVARGPVRVDAVIDVEVRALRALEQDRLPVREGLVNDEARVRDELLQARGELPVLVEDPLEDERLRPAEGEDDPVFGGEVRFQFFPEDDRVEDVRDADAPAADLVLEGGADAALRRLRRHAALHALLERVERLVPRHDDVRAVAHAEVLDRVPALAQAVDLLEELSGVDDDAVPDHVEHVRPDDPAREEAERERVAPDLDRVARVRAAVEADDEVGLRRQDVDDLALPFISKLAANDGGPGHGSRRGTKGRILNLRGPAIASDATRRGRTRARAPSRP